MAKTATRQIRNMQSGEIADDTRMIFRIASDSDILAAVDAYDEYALDNAAWVLANPNSAVPEFAEVANRANPTIPEKLFVEVRFIVEFDDDTPPKRKSAPWAQVNSINTPALAATFLQDLGKNFNARRTSLGLDPV